jgi:hypothetical protein
MLLAENFVQIGRCALATQVVVDGILAWRLGVNVYPVFVVIGATSFA